MKNMIIPVAIQIGLDDVAWDKGNDMRLVGEQSRTGMPRYHTIEDYEAVEMLGKAFNQKILCHICMIDWDKDNLLRGQKGITHNPDGWNRAAEIDIKKMEGFARYMSDAKYMELALHGVSHGAYTDEGKRIHESEFFRAKELYGLDRSLPLEKWDFDRRMELFFKIYDSWGFGQKIRTFDAPGGTCGTATEDLRPLAKWLKGAGIEYWFDSFCDLQPPMFNLEGLPCLHASYKYPKSPKWNVYDFDPMDMLPQFHTEDAPRMAGHGMHWPNILRYNPRRNPECVALWIEFYSREAEKFGTMMARDIAFATAQGMYSYYAKTEKTKGGYRFDLSEARAMAGGKKAPLYISVRGGKRPMAKGNAKASLYEEKKDFITYEVESDADVFEVDLI